MVTPMTSGGPETICTQVTLPSASAVVANTTVARMWSISAQQGAKIGSVFFTRAFTCCCESFSDSGSQQSMSRCCCFALRSACARQTPLQSERPLLSRSLNAGKTRKVPARRPKFSNLFVFWSSSLVATLLFRAPSGAKLATHLATRCQRG